MSTAAEPCRPTPADLAGTASRIGAAIESVIQGKPDAVRLILTVLIAAGHVLIEDVAGVGKTMLAKALGRAVDCSVSRIQFTPDLLPSDITGVSAYVSQTGEFEFRPGPVFASIVVGDEINRASAKTQSALLECMEEQHVTVDGKTYELEPMSSTSSRLPAAIPSCAWARRRGRHCTWPARLARTRRSTGAIT